ncbi:MAG: RNA polymerase subunit sigma [Candidatus Riflebacteria bacterium]|nr:RNA polymerase subunit sigma [Candidatus Riflebacteria bacterium]
MGARLARELEVIGRSGRLAVLTGAGVSAESGIPTFRGRDGYWTVGSREYHPQQMATLNMFETNPWDVWQWYLYRLGVCLAAGPNEGHRAIARMESLLADRFLLLTQNVDGLHLEAGNSPARTYQIHGNIAYMRCAVGCSRELRPVPREMVRTSKTVPVSAAERELLVCQRCRGLARPHVLWFDECYDEEFYRLESSLQAAHWADALLVVGTSGATSLPMRVGEVAARRAIVIVDVNPAENPFSEIAESSPRGFSIRRTACETLPAIVEALARAGRPPGESGSSQGEIVPGHS